MIHSTGTAFEVLNEDWSCMCDLQQKILFHEFLLSFLLVLCEYLFIM